MKRNYEKINLMLGEIGGTCDFIFSLCNRIAAYFLRNIINEGIFNFIIFKNKNIWYYYMKNMNILICVLNNY